MKTLHGDKKRGAYQRAQRHERPNLGELPREPCRFGLDGARLHLLGHGDGRCVLLILPLVGEVSDPFLQGFPSHGSGFVEFLQDDGQPHLKD